MRTLRGMTWSHPRGRDPLLALAREAEGDGPLAVPGSRVAWDAQPLGGFESHPIADLAGRYDLIVLDHPGLGDALAADALAPLDELLGTDELARLEDGSVGASLASYRCRGHQWALPIDAATQVCATRADAPFAPPATWDEALALAAGDGLAIPTAAPHALLTFLGLCAAHDPDFAPDARRLAPRDVAEAALELLRALHDATPVAQRDRDPIELLDRMADADDTSAPLCVPLVYGYVTYSAPEVARRVRFGDAPSLAPGGVPGSVLGGTGLAIARRSAGDADALAHLRQAVHPLAQTTAIPQANGQPAAVAAWEDPAVNARSLDFYAGTRRTQETAWRRPRHAGWIAFQTSGSHLLLDGLRSKRAARELLDELDDDYRAARGGGG